LTDFLDEYAEERHQPLSTFNGIFNDFLKARGADHRRRYKWSGERAREFLDAIMKKFIISESGQGVSERPEGEEAT
jgi:hypothetical protein